MAVMALNDVHSGARIPAESQRPKRPRHHIGASLSVSSSALEYVDLGGEGGLERRLPASRLPAHVAGRDAFALRQVGVEHGIIQPHIGDHLGLREGSPLGAHPQTREAH